MELAVLKITCQVNAADYIKKWRDGVGVDVFYVEGWGVGGGMVVEPFK